MDIQPVCPFVIRRPAMKMRWETLTFLHWAYDPEAVQRLLPAGLHVEPFDGRAWIGLVPFMMNITAPATPYPPWLGRFCETNVRTYVRDDAGRSGIWFFSLDAARLAAVVAARGTLGLPYVWSRMSLRSDGGVIDYASRRRWPGRRNAGGRIAVRPGPDCAADELTARDHFLTARWALFSVAGRRLIRVEAEHPPWQLRHVEVLTIDDTLVCAAGLPATTTPPLAHFSDGVDVRVGWPHLA